MFTPPQDVTKPSLIASETFSTFLFPWIDRSRSILSLLEHSGNMVSIQDPRSGLVLTSVTCSVLGLISQAFLLVLSRAVAVQLPRR